ncbi:hypothetical protein BWI17_18785 [Betaproteobacteria bacterium GR16-43]|nr:hypothetical protein BWI17_18785 [Betaproteobacteria bacterium GR16-43]
MNKKLVSAAVIATLGFASGSALARPYGESARVIEATPIYQPVSVPAQQCWTQPVTRYEERRVVQDVPQQRYVRDNYVGPGTVLGAIIGGVVGHQFGHSTAGRDHGTAAGVLVGGLVGNSIENAQNPGRYVQAVDRQVYVDRVPVTQEVQRCRTVQETRSEIVGYNVRYVYQGREHYTRMNERPGPYISVNVRSY